MLARSHTCRENKGSKLKLRSNKVLLASKLSRRPEHMKFHVYGQSRVQQLYGKAKNHHQKTVTKGVNIGISKKTEGSTTPSPQDGAWTQSDAKFFVSKTEPDDTAKYGSASRPRRRIRTNPSTSAHRQSEKHFGAAPGSQTLARRVVHLKFKRTTTLPSPLN